MNLRLVSRLLGVVALLIGGAMIFSLPWASPKLGLRLGLEPPVDFETRGFWALSISIVICGLVGGLLMWLGRKRTGRLFRKEAMAVVGLSWVLATVLGALPYYLGSRLPDYMGVSDTACYLGDGVNARVVRVGLKYAAEETVAAP